MALRSRHAPVLPTQRCRELAGADALFRLQVLLRATSRIQGREVALLQLLMACFGLFTDGASFEPHGLLIGPEDHPLAFFGADACWRRAWFDERLRTGSWQPARPARRRVVAGSEIAALLVPATKWCASDNVLRSGGAVPSAPNALVTYRHQPHVMPLGYLDSARGQRLVALRSSDTRFWSLFGAAGSGKSEIVSLQLVWSALHARWRRPAGPAGHDRIGSLTIDPHGQILERIPAYLWAARDRLLILDVANRRPEVPVAAWNPLDMTGRDASDIEGVVKPLVDALALVNRWDPGRNSRAINLIQNTLMALTQVNLALPAHCQATVFQVISLLTDEAWRDKLLQASDGRGEHPVHQPPAEVLRRLLRHRRPGPAPQPAGGDQRGHPHPVPDARLAADRGHVRLLPDRLRHAPGDGHRAGGDRLHRRRQPHREPADGRDPDLHPAVRRDEPGRHPRVRAPAVPRLPGRAAHLRRRRDDRRPAAGGPQDAAGGEGGGVCVLDQDPGALKANTARALATNGSHMLAGAVATEEAAWLAKQWGGLVTPTTLARLAAGAQRPDDTRRFEYVGQVTVDGRKTSHSGFRGVPVAEVFADQHRPERLAELHRAVDRNARRRLPAQVIAELDTLDDRITKALDHLQAPSRSRPGRPRAGGHQTYTRDPRS